MEQNKAQQMSAFLTLKQKIFSTEYETFHHNLLYYSKFYYFKHVFYYSQLIREFQSTKVECDILTRKNEEFARLIDQLHRDLSKRNQDYTTVYGEAETLKRV